jgi:hypothetical protein
MLFHIHSAHPSTLPSFFPLNTRYSHSFKISCLEASHSFANHIIHSHCPTFRPIHPLPPSNPTVVYYKQTPSKNVRKVLHRLRGFCCCRVCIHHSSKCCRLKDIYSPSVANAKDRPHSAPTLATQLPTQVSKRPSQQAPISLLHGHQQPKAPSPSFSSVAQLRTSRSLAQLLRRFPTPVPSSGRSRPSWRPM